MGDEKITGYIFCIPFSGTRVQQVLPKQIHIISASVGAGHGHRYYYHLFRFSLNASCFLQSL